MLTEYLHILFTLPTAGYGLVTLYSAYQLWQADEHRHWIAVATALSAALMLGSAWFLWRGDNAGFTLLLLALLSLHSLVLNSEQTQGAVNWREQIGRFALSAVLLLLGYLAVS